jgi:hypothetical protein
MSFEAKKNEAMQRAIGKIENLKPEEVNQDTLDGIKAELETIKQLLAEKKAKEANKQ